MNDFIDFFYNDDEQLKKYENLFLKLLKHTKEILNIKKPLSFSINFISEQESIQLNKKYRNKNYIGDVISFPIDDDFGIYDQLDFKEIGDIFITYNEACRKAKLYNHKIEEEISWLFVHGLLHILGYDHEQDEKEADKMFSLTNQVLAKENIYYKINL